MLHPQVAAVLDNTARSVLPLLLRGMGLRSDALSGVLDEIHLPSTVMSSSELHAARYRGPANGEQGLLSTAVCQPLNREGKVTPSRGPRQ